MPDEPDMAERKLPDCNELFDRYFRPWYEEGSSSRFAGILSDFMSGFRKGMKEEDLPHLPAEALTESRQRVETMARAAQNDMKRYLELKDPLSIDWFEAFDRHWDRPLIQELIDGSDPADFSNDYIVICCEMGALIGHFLKQAEPNLLWIYAWPYWDSGLYCPSSGKIAYIFHWAIKRMTEYGVDDPLHEKVEAGLGYLKLQEPPEVISDNPS